VQTLTFRPRSAGIFRAWAGLAAHSGDRRLAKKLASRRKRGSFAAGLDDLATALTLEAAVLFAHEPAADRARVALGPRRRLFDRGLIRDAALFDGGAARCTPAGISTIAHFPPDCAAAEPTTSGAFQTASDLVVYQPCRRS